jgi:glutamyl/glutaminyl-tRNA synthetase
MGNIFNFLHTYRFSKNNKCSLALRIDDHDYIRCKEEYVEEVFKVLELLKIDIDEGPSSVSEFYSDYTQKNKMELYFSELEKLKEKFVCECSRKEVFQTNELGIYQGTCREKGLVFNPGNNLIRFFCPDETIKLSEKEVNLKEKIGDTILWRKDNLVSYQLMSVLEDIEMGVTHIVRGEDLLTSSAVQIAIARFISKEFPKEENFFHHDLLSNNGEKLSKSRGDSGAIELLEKDVGEVVRSYCRFFNLDTVSSVDELTKI